AAGLAGDFRLVQRRLQLGHLGLHLLRLFHHLAEILHASSSGSVGSDAASSSMSESLVDCVALRSRTASIVAPGKASSTALTSGCSDARRRISASIACACSFKVGAPRSPETLTNQRDPVHSLRQAAIRFGRLAGAFGVGLSSIRPTSKL